MKVGAAWGWDGRGGVRLRGCEWKAEGAEPSQSRREVCFGGCDDSVTIWGRRGAGWGREDGEGGWAEEKPMPTDGMEGGELIDLLSVSSSEDQ